MIIVAGDYSLSIYEGTEQFSRPHLLVPHPQYNSINNDNDIMLIKVQYPKVTNNMLVFCMVHYSMSAITLM